MRGIEGNLGKIRGDEKRKNSKTEKGKWKMENWTVFLLPVCDNKNENTKIEEKNTMIKIQKNK